MKILRIAYEWPPPWDGLNPGIYELTQAQIKLGNQVEVFSSKNFPRALKRFSLFLTTAPAVLFGYLFYRLRGKEIDVVHGHGHITCCFNLYKFLFGWLDKTPYFLHLHITAVGREAAAKERGVRLGFWTKYFEWPLHKFSDRIGCRVADAVIATSKVVKAEAVRFYNADSEKVFVVENGVNTRLFARPRKTLRVSPSTLRVGELAERRNLLYVGALSRRKNIHLLLEAMKFLPEDYHLTVVGRGEEEYPPQDSVKFVGYVEYPQLPKYYQQADVLVLPSSYEGFPKVVLEALSCGVPVLASGFRLQEDIKGLSFLNKLDAKSLAAEIKKIVESGEKVDVEKIHKKYDWLVKVTQIQRIYDRIGGRKLGN